MSLSLPRSIAIAGAWGYIGRKFLDAARSLGLRTIIFDPGPLPDDLDPGGIERVANEQEFYRRPADLFYLALHPEHRRLGMEMLLERSREEANEEKGGQAPRRNANAQGDAETARSQSPFLARSPSPFLPMSVLCEKPMALPERPQACRETIEAVDRSRAVVLYDFPELFDPIARRIVEFLSGFRSVSIDSIYLQRSKDREDPANPRNRKRMVHVQYQESVHCLAFALYVLAGVRGGLEAVFADGLSVAARAEPYAPPNPEDYPRAVDGKCEYRLALGPVAVEGKTDFKRHAEWTKRRIIRGTADGRPLHIEADFLEGHKYLLIDGRPEPDVQTNSCAEVLRTYGRWRSSVPAEQLMHGLYPNPRFAHVAYRLSSVLWHGSRRPVRLRSLRELLAFETGNL